MPAQASWTFLSNSWTSKIKSSLTRLRVNSNFNDILKEGLVGLWSFNGPDMLGGTVYDRSGFGNNLVQVDLATSTAIVPGKIGQGLHFESGVTDYLEGEDVSTFDFGTGPFSVSLWFKTSFAGAGVRLVNTRTICTHDVFWEVNIGVGKFQPCVEGGSAETLTCLAGNATVNDDEWHHAVFTRNGTSLKGYVDGALDDTATAGSVVDLTNSAPLRIGDSICANDYNGELDEVRIYNRALSTAEIARLYSAAR